MFFANVFRNEFEKLLKDTVKLSNAMVCQTVLESGEIVTQYTLETEKKTSNFTGIPIDTSITLQELRLQPENDSRITENIVNQV